MTQVPPASQPDQPDEPDRSPQPDEPDQGSQEQSTEPGDSGRPDQPTDPDQGSPDQPDQPTEPGDSDQPDQPAPAGLEAEPVEPPAGPPPPPPSGESPKPRRLALKITLAVLAAVVVLCVVGAVVLVNTFRGEIPAAGDCLSDAADPNDLQPVDCDDPEAAWTVLGVDRTVSRAGFDDLTGDELCQDHGTTSQALWVTDALFVGDDTEGSVLCLERVDTE